MSKNKIADFCLIIQAFTNKGIVSAIKYSHLNIRHVA